MVENDMARSKGLFKGSWHETHNMYTQISSENGIPAALMYIAILALALRQQSEHRKSRNITATRKLLRWRLFGCVSH